jgi:hypothetical protein
MRTEKNQIDFQAEYDHIPKTLDNEKNQSTQIYRCLSPCTKGKPFYTQHQAIMQG